MQPKSLEPIGEELAIQWDDGAESFVRLEQLRRHCPCAACHGEVDILGNLYKAPDRPYAANAFKLVRLHWVGGYAIQPFWADGHSSGLFAWDYLRRVADAGERQR